MSATSASSGSESDPGLQPERTGLAWQRTALAAGAVALLLLHVAASSDWSGLTVAAAFGGVTALTLAIAGGRREHQLRHTEAPPPASARLIGATAVLVLVTALVTLVTAVLAGAPTR